MPDCRRRVYRLGKLLFGNGLIHRFRSSHLLRKINFKLGKRASSIDRVNFGSPKCLTICRFVANYVIIPKRRTSPPHPLPFSGSTLLLTKGRPTKCNKLQVVKIERAESLYDGSLKIATSNEDRSG